MRKQKKVGRIFTPGGIVSPGELRRIASTANHFGVRSISLGERQDVSLTFEAQDLKDIALRFRNIQYKFSVENSKFQNIVSSYPVKSLDQSTAWLSEGIYKEIINSFDYVPHLKINICDPQQGMIPLFSGQLNFLASTFENYWYLYINLRTSEEPYKWPVLVDTREIGQLSTVIEKVLSDQISIDYSMLMEKVYNSREWTFRVTDSKPDLNPKRFFYYEGFHPMGENMYWLGIYERLNQYPVTFLEALSMLCMQTDTGSISFTPYRSIIIKNIARKDVHRWQDLLGKFKINTGHSSLEVNFRMPDLNPDALKLRKFIFDYFDNREVRTEGLVIGLHSSADDRSSIMVEKKWMVRFGSINLFPFYNIKYRKDFNSNNHEVITFSGYVKKRDVPEVLIFLSEKYYQMVTEQANRSAESHSGKAEPVKDDKELYACKSCMTVYDQEYGDDFNKIHPGIPFHLLPMDYKCPVCEGTKELFIKFTPETLLA